MPPAEPLRELLALPQQAASGLTEQRPPPSGPLADSELAAQLQCPEREPGLERALAYWGGGPRLDPHLFAEFCNRLPPNRINAARKAPLYAFAVILLKGVVHLRCCTGDSTCEMLLRGGLADHKDLRDTVGLLQDVLKTTSLEMQMLLAFGDEPFTTQALYSNVPVFHPLSSEAYWTVPWPSVYHIRDLLAGALDAPGDGGVAWEDKAPTAWWRGTLIAPSTTLLSTAPFLPRVRLVRLAADAPELVDAAFTGIHPTLYIHQWGRQGVETVLRKNRARVLAWEDFNVSAPRHKFVLVVPGVTQSTQLGRVLRSGSVPLLVSDALHEWLQPALEPWIHFVPIRNDLSDLLPALRWLRDHDEVARQIARSASSMAAERTTVEATYCYVWRGLRALRDLTGAQSEMLPAAAGSFTQMPDMELGRHYEGFRPLRERLQERADAGGSAEARCGAPGISSCAVVGGSTEK